MPIDCRNMSRKLHRVRVYTDILVMANNGDDALKIVKPYAAKELEVDCHSDIQEVNGVSDVPNGWRDVVPYCQEGSDQEERKCVEIARSIGMQSTKPIDSKQEHIPTTTTTTTRPTIQVGRVSSHKHGLARSEGSMRL